ncbi:THAP domain-containing protein 5-like isoform X2 [Trachinotus anak]|uniref:THAP domain-containing protein 5-like isoform X2 n=1 Tax=Trachinotus anak TaxID=443729 RepID=UPI0039F1DA20
MPRYCAVKACRNRGGSASRQDNKRISFYPFPLQDKPRLQKWVDNMKREEWTPSRHQCLCSEHFTEDCFDIRWGIRYLKNTAIPTIFHQIEDDGDKKVTTIKRSPKVKPRTLDIDTEPTGFDCPHNTGISCHTNQSEIQTAAGEVPGDSGMPTASCLALSPCDEPQSEELADSTVTVLCCESLGPFPDGEVNVDVASPQAALGQAFSFIPVEIVKDEPTGCFLGEGGPGEGEHISVYEHSYSRPDTDKDQLWSKILSLHSKILELDRREESAVAKIRALETEIALLRRDGAVFKEKQKVLEDYISSMLL